MDEVKELLQLIENVSPADTQKLDEIDARVWCFLKLNDTFKVYFHDKGGAITYRHNSWNDDQRSVLRHGFSNPQYTRSRDALKAIRPEGWATDMTIFSIRPNANCEMHKIEYHGSFGSETHTVGADFQRATEELAELHCIIQAIAYDRKLQTA